MKVRLTSDLRQKIENAARKNNRTMNGEIVARLEQAFREEGHAASPVQAPDLEKRLALLEAIWPAISNRLAMVEHRLGEQTP